jgi:hypothetical protein
MIDNATQSAAHMADHPYDGGMSRRHADVPPRGIPETASYPHPTPPRGYQRVPVPSFHDVPAEPRAQYRPQVPIEQRYEPLSQRTPFELALPALRREVGGALGSLSQRQALVAWERRRGDALGPHALVLFYAEPPAGDPPSCALRVGCRNFLADDEPRLAHLLDQMCTTAERHIQARNDLRTHLTNWCEEMSRDAFFLGVGVATLDTPEASWQDTQRNARSDMDIPGAGFVVLRDGTHLLMERRAFSDLGDISFTTDKTVGDTSHMLRRRWSYRPNFTDSDDLDRRSRDTWACLSRLHTVLLGAGYGC